MGGHPLPLQFRRHRRRQRAYSRILIMKKRYPNRTLCARFHARTQRYQRKYDLQTYASSTLHTARSSGCSIVYGLGVCAYCKTETAYAINGNNLTRVERRCDVVRGGGFKFNGSDFVSCRFVWCWCWWWNAYAYAAAAACVCLGVILTKGVKYILNQTHTQSCRLS